MNADQLRLSAVLKDTISLLCKNSLHYDRQLVVQGVIAVTIDQGQVAVVQVNDVIGEPSDEPCVACGRATTNAENHAKKRRNSTLESPRKKRSNSSGRKSPVEVINEETVLGITSHVSTAEEELRNKISVKEEGLSGDVDLKMIDAGLNSVHTGETVHASNSTQLLNHEHNSESSNLMQKPDDSHSETVMDSLTINYTGSAQLAALTTGRNHSVNWVPWGTADGSVHGGKVLKQSQDEPNSNHQEPHHLFTCLACSISYSLAASLEDHVRTVHSDDMALCDRPFVCPWPGCMKSFKEGRLLKQHHMVHSVEEVFQCPMCSYRSYRKGNLHRHLSCVHK